MARQPKRRGEAPRMPQKPVTRPLPLQAELIPIAGVEDMEAYLLKHPNEISITAIPGAKEVGFPYIGVISEPVNFRRDRELMLMGKAVGRLERKERTSAPKTVRRNVEICDLRAQDRKKWSLTKLAKKYELTTRAITKVLKEEVKWRKLAASLGTD